jgi:uncharacterized membrane protein YsdA (DUF1294 family)
MRDARNARTSPGLVFLLVAGVVVGGSVALALHLGRHPLLGALAGINVATMVLYGYDKAVAGGARLRVPENVLHLLAFLGGSPAALLSQVLFRHKTLKPSFRRTWWLIVALQIAMLAAGAWIAWKN